MATLTLSAPMTTPMALVSPTSWYKTRDGLKTQMIKRWKEYGSYIKKFAKTSKVPEEIIFAFMMVESGGNSVAGGESSATQGLMQFNKNYVAGTPNSTLGKEYLQGRLSDVEKEILAKYGFNVAKYLPFGPVRDVMPYLIRRAEENTSVAGQTSRELNLLKTERQRRKQNK
jgi:hypothetical protein